ncbi:MAG TPA: MCP four helix bundle domain-containing protein, partial [Pseudomonas sp.]|nr:MCP four helix bundle domain-containing protein [Pseudomonas sp.]
MLALLERLALRRKLILGFVALLILALALGVQSLRTQARLVHDLENLYNRDLVGAVHLQEARVQLPHIVQALHRSAGTSNAEVRLESLKQLQDARQLLREELALAKATLWRPENLASVAELELLLERHQQIGEETLQLTGEGRQGQAQLLLNSDEFVQLDAKADALLEQVAEVK